MSYCTDLIPLYYYFDIIFYFNFRQDFPLYENLNLIIRKKIFVSQISYCRIDVRYLILRGYLVFGILIVYEIFSEIFRENFQIGNGIFFRFDPVLFFKVCWLYLGPKFIFLWILSSICRNFSRFLKAFLIYVLVFGRSLVQ